MKKQSSKDSIQKSNSFLPQNNPWLDSKSKLKNTDKNKFEENFISPQNGQNGPKMNQLKNNNAIIFWKILPLVLPEKKLKVMLLFIFHQKLHTSENWFASYGSKFFHPVRFQDSLKYYNYIISQEKKLARDQVDFLHQVPRKLILLFLVGKPDMPKVPIITSLKYHAIS